MALTDKQEAFCQNRAHGRNASDAYRMAYDTDDSKPQTIWNEAYLLSQNPDVAFRIQTLQKELEDQALWSRANSVEVLIDVIFSPESGKKEVIAATKELNAMHGYNAAKQLEIKTAGSVEVRQMPVDPIEASKAYMDMVRGK